MLGKISRKERSIKRSTAYAVGTEVGESGWYVCVPCGYRRFLERGGRFPRCLKCLAGRGFKKGLELWEKAP